MTKAQHKIKFLLVFACAFLCFAQVKAQTETAEFNNRNLHQWGAVGLFQGLPSDRVRAIAQDDSGVFWFGTERGLARYDGRTVQIVAAENLQTNRILALKLAADGALWIGAETGAFRFANEKFEAIQETAGKAVSSILLAPERGSVILTSLNGQIFECKQNANNDLTVETIPREPRTAADSEPNNLLQITSAAVRNQTLLAGSLRRGLLHFDETKRVLGEVTSRPRAFFVNALAKSERGDLWLGADAGTNDSGLFLINDLQRPEKVGANLGAIAALDFDRNDDLWIGTAERGAFLFRGRQQISNFTFQNTAGGLRSNRIYTVFVDREAVVWFGTDRGAFRFDPNAPRSNLVSTDAESNFVRTLLRARNGELFAGTNRGLFRFSESLQQWQALPNFERKTVFALNETVAGKILVGTASGIFALGDDANDSDSSAKNDGVRAIETFAGKTYAAIFGRGVAAIDANEHNQIFAANQTETARDAICLHNEADKTLWIGTTKSGVFKFENNRIATEPALEKLKNTAVRAIAGTRENAIWFATDDGLFVLKNNELENVLPAVAVRDVLIENPNENQSENQAAQDQPKIWAATANGLFRIIWNRNFGWTISKLDSEGGLPSQNTFALLPLAGNNLLVGTNRGAVRYNQNDAAPLLIATRVASQRLYKSEELANRIALEYPQNSLTLEVAAQSSRTFPEEFQYAFLLRDAAGNTIKKRLSRDAAFLLEDLPPGDYAIEAIGFNRDLTASRPLVVRFNVARAPFPATATALGVLLVFALIALVWAIAGQRKIYRTNRELAAARLDLANEAERTRRRIARDLHDQTLADLRHLLMLTDKTENENANGTAQVFRQEIEKVSTEIRRICEDLSPSVLENIGFAAALEFALQTAASDGKFETEFVCSEDFEENFRFSPSVQIQIYRIAQEVLNNIARHARATRVRLAIENKTEFLLTIENDGRAFEPQNRSRKSRGINNINARASLIEARVNWEKSRNETTIFTLQKSNAVESHTV